jgi:hypothetical protein
MAIMLRKTSHAVKILLIAILILINCDSLLTQDASQKAQSGIAANDLVNIIASVRDKKGNYVKNLAQDDFAIKEDGRKQTISNFFREVDLPLTIGVILDFSAGTQGAANQLQLGGKAFFKKVIRPTKDGGPGDGLFILKSRSVQRGAGRGMTSDGTIELVQDLTTDPAKIEKAVGLIAWDGLAGSTMDTQIQTMLADTIILSTQKLAQQQGRKALIIVGDGNHIGNRSDMAIQWAQQTDTQIFTIFISDPSSGVTTGGGGMGGFGGGGFGRFGSLGGGMPATSDAVYSTNFQILSSKTGGAYFEYSGKKSLDKIYGDIEEELRSQYVLGYTPLESKNSRFRKIEVKVLKDGLTARACEGYYPERLLTNQSPSN